MAGDEDRGDASRQSLSPELVAVVRDVRRHRRGQHCHAIPSRPIYAALVLLAKYDPDRAGADCGSRRHRAVAAQPRQQAGLPTFLSVAGAVRAVLCRARHQHVSLYRAAEHHDLAGGVSPKQPALHAGRRCRAHSAHSRLYLVGLLGVPRQGKARKRLSLMPGEQKPRPLAQRLLWFALLWLGGVGTVTIVSYALRLWLAPK